MTALLKKYKYFIILIIFASSISGYLIYYGYQIKNELPSSEIIRPATPENRTGQSSTSGKSSEFYNIKGLHNLTSLTFYASFQDKPVAPELFLTDPLSRRVGVDPDTNQFFSEIPQSSYYEDEIGADEGTGKIGPVKVLDIMEPMEGRYQLQIVGTASGSYNLITRTEDRGGGVQSISIEGVIDEGVVSTFGVNYSSTPGTPTKIEQKEK